METVCYMSGFFMKYKRLVRRAAENFLFSLLIIVASVLLAHFSPSLAPAGSTPGGEERVVLPVVVIDAGHGGADCGAVGIGGVLEMDLNLRLALLLAEEFRDAGYETELTRSEDVVLSDGEEHRTKKEGDLLARVKAAGKAGLFLSLHLNKFPQSRYRGAQVYFAPSEGSRELADAIQSQLRGTLQTYNNREIKDGSSLFLLQRIACPAVLIECGFLSNPEDVAALTDEKYLADLAREIFFAVDGYVSERLPGKVTLEKKDGM